MKDVEEREVLTFDEEEKETLEKRKNEILGILIIALGLLSAIAIFTSTGGVVGNKLSDIYRQIMGIGAYLIPLLFMLWGVTLIRYKGLRINSRLIGFLISYMIVLAIIHTYLYPEFTLDYALRKQGGGFLGGGISWMLVKMFGPIGAYIFLGAFLLIGVLLWSDVLLQSILDWFKQGFKAISRINFRKKINRTAQENEETFYQFEDREEINNQEELEIDEEEIAEGELDIYTDNNELDREKIPSGQAGIKKENKKITSTYTLPRLSILKTTGKRKIKLENKTELLEETLNSFGVKAKVIQVSHGPTITRYELQPASGVKVSRIVNLSDDIALALAASGVRIEAPIPGKAAVGIEVPHSGNLMVRLGDVLASNEFSKAKSKLTLALGKGIDGQPIVTDLAQMPHLLVAGATGSGKSVCINTLITSIIYKATPDEVKLLLVDPKKVELSNYKGLPHLFTPVVTDPKKAANVLKLVVDEMEKRYELFSASGTRGITSYNKEVDPEERLPYIVVIIDELADLMMVAANEVEDNICRLAQMSRAAGIHLIIATQRPSVDVITGLIKANIPSRISFAVSSQTDSRTILDMGGAEKLLGKGDMLFAPVGAQKPQRVQGAFIDNDEIRRLVKFVSGQADPEYEVELEQINKIELSLDDEQDELFEEAVKLVVKYRASISMLQRRLHIGHSRAARLIDMMEEEGIVGPYAGSKPREVLLSEEELASYFAEEEEVVEE